MNSAPAPAPAPAGASASASAGANARASAGASASAGAGAGAGASASTNGDSPGLWHPRIWSDWGVYIVSYLGANERRDSASRLSSLLPMLAGMGMTPHVCAGKNALLAGRGTVGKVWLTHTAAVYQHVRSARAANPCLVLEDDVEFLGDAAHCDAQLRRMLSWRPDYKLINLGALHAGASIPIGGNLIMSSNCVLAHSTLYSPALCQKIVERAALVTRPGLGECLQALHMRDRLAAFPSLTTQSAWPVVIPQPVRTVFGSFEHMHRAINVYYIVGVPAAFALFGAAGLAAVLQIRATAQFGTRTANIGRNISIVATVCALFLIAVAIGANVAVAHYVDVDAETNQAMTAAFSHPDFLRDFCPLEDGSPDA